MLEHTNDHVSDDGTVTRLSSCVCGRCKNRWYVACAPEFEPNYCPYCGLKFKWYDDGEKAYGMNGFPIE